MHEANKKFAKKKRQQYVKELNQVKNGFKAYKYLKDVLYWYIQPSLMLYIEIKLHYVVKMNLHNNKFDEKIAIWCWIVLVVDFGWWSRDIQTITQLYPEGRLYNWEIEGREVKNPFGIPIFFFPLFFSFFTFFSFSKIDFTRISRKRLKYGVYTIPFGFV